MPTPTLTERLVPLLEATVAKGTLMLASESLTPEQFALIVGQTATLWKALRPANITAVNISGQVNDTNQIFMLSGVASRRLVLISVNGLIVPHTKWSFSESNQALTLTNPYRFPAAAVVEVYVLWHGDEALATPPSA